jgi:hypothetical protein
MGLDSFTQKAETPSTQLLAALPRVMNRRSRAFPTSHQGQPSLCSDMLYYFITNFASLWLRTVTGFDHVDVSSQRRSRSHHVHRVNSGDAVPV